MRRKIVNYGLILMLIIFSLSISVGLVSAEQKKEDMEKSIGDKWEYRYTSITENVTMVFTMSMEITDETVVEINGNNYDVLEAVIDGKIMDDMQPKQDMCVYTAWRFRT